MSNKFIDLIEDVINKTVDIKVIKKICKLYDKLQYCYDLDEMISTIYKWFEKNHNIKDFVFATNDIDKNTNCVLLQKGKPFKLDDPFTFYFIIDTKTEFNAVVSFRANNKKEYKKLSEKYRFLEILFTQISPILQSAMLKNLYLKAASIDSVTNLYSRKHLLSHINKTLKVSKETKDSITFLVIGIDRFKAVIDEFDYDIGDMVLVELAKVIHANIKQKDIVARLTGDEFLVSLINVSNINIVEKIASNIIEQFSNKFVIVNEETQQKLKKTICIGISSYPKDSQDIDKVIKNADNFLYKAKNNGRSTYAIYTDDKENEIDLF